MGELLRIEGLTKRFGGIPALDCLDMCIPEGAVYGFIGKNGAGKTTLIKILGGLLHADGGGFFWGDGGDTPPLSFARPRMGLIAGAPAMYGDMTAYENLRQQYRILGLQAHEGIRDQLATVGLPDTGSKKAKHFSQGMRQKLGIAMALCGNPSFVMLDEPCNGLDPQGVIELRELIRRLHRERQITFLISSHQLDELARVATHYGFIDHGRMLRQLTAEELTQELHKTVRMRVSNAGCLARILTGMHAGYRMLSDTEVDVLTPIRIVQVAVQLAEADCELYACAEQEESLETYFLRLAGGDGHA